MEFLTSLSEWGYAGLFIAAFLAGSILPFSSEVVLGLLLVAGYSTWGCVVSATAGNWLGGITCYYIGRLGKTAWIEKYLKLSHEKLDKTQRFLQGKGSLMGFFAFVPGVGDAIVFGAHACQSLGCCSIDVARERNTLLSYSHRCGMDRLTPMSLK